MARFIIFDTETTGKTASSRLVSLAWILGDSSPDVVSTERHFLVRPNGFVIPREATQVHGITTEQARAHGRPIHEVLDAFFDDIAGFGPKRLVAHNFDFDSRTLNQELDRLGNPHCISSRSFCTMRETRNICRIPRPAGGYKFPKLDELYFHLFRTVRGIRHDALADARDTWLCFRKLMQDRLVSIEADEDPHAAPPPQPPPLAQAFVFSANEDTWDECLCRRLFGSDFDWPLQIKEGDIVLLYNYDRDRIAGLWEAILVGMDIDRVAWEGHYRFQCRVSPLTPKVIAVTRRNPPFSPGRIPWKLTGTYAQQVIQHFQNLAASVELGRMRARRRDGL